MKKNSYSIHPVVIFWLGLLTGALIVGLVFFYRFLTPAEYESSLFRVPKIYYDYSYDKSLNNIGDSGGYLSRPGVSIGDPGGY